MCKQMDVFAFSQEAQFFLKARCARLEPWHLLPPRRNICRQRCTSKQLLTARCAARAFLFAVCAAAVLRAHQLVQLEYQQEQEQRKKSMEHRQQHCVAVQAATHSVEFYLPPRFFPKEMAIFTPEPSQNFRLRRALLIPPLAGRAAGRT